MCGLMGSGHIQYVVIKMSAEKGNLFFTRFCSQAIYFSQSIWVIIKKWSNPERQNEKN